MDPSCEMQRARWTAPIAPVCHDLQCQCRVHTSHPATSARAPGDMWRPWLNSLQDTERGPRSQLSAMSSYLGNQVPHSSEADKSPVFQHPVKILWPKSKCFDYMYEDAANLLANYPAQATISFYEESDSNEESEEDEESEHTD